MHQHAFGGRAPPGPGGAFKLSQTLWPWKGEGMESMEEKENEEGREGGWERRWMSPTMLGARIDATGKKMPQKRCTKHNVIQSTVTTGAIMSGSLRKTP